MWKAWFKKKCPISNFLVLRCRTPVVKILSSDSDSFSIHIYSNILKLYRITKVLFWECAIVLKWLLKYPLEIILIIKNLNSTGQF